MVAKTFAREMLPGDRGLDRSSMKCRRGSVTFAATAALLLAVSALASYPPARRAMLRNLTEALRAD